ncbi:hypothetical protein [Enterovibrio norvegicus]|uniref:hypothetical protein n=1 Tax=Enterovibrio norvegicus TaxID=188144 RepID=UPI000C85844E|nr:hypothetical protein [Enterovibrio norvegicus]PMH64444.1 hypothetical protein BCU62_15430 [Enterovibrio norvegicus]
MEIEVQSITITETRTERRVSQLMKSAIPAKYDYSFVVGDTFLRYSSETPGPIKALVMLDEVLSSEIISESETTCHLLIDQGTDVCILVQVKDGLALNIENIIKEAITEDRIPKGLLIISRSLQPLLPHRDHRDLPELQQSKIDNTPHKLVEKKQRKRTKFGALVVGIGAILCGYVIYASTTKEPEIKPEVEIKQVIEVKKIRLDRFYDYKANLQNRMTYGEIYKPLMVGALLSSKLPEGWVVDSTSLTELGIETKIYNTGGRTQLLKHYRDTSEYADFIDIEGQFAQFNYPITPTQWWSWTKRTDEFSKVRDDFMDQMILMGAKLRSQDATYSDEYTLQKWEVVFEEHSLAYLDIFNTLMNEKPIFIDSFVVKPLSQKHSTRALITFNATIIGR